MNEDVDLEALGREWRRIDMKTIELALETGKLRREFTWGFALMTAIAAFLVYVLWRGLTEAAPWTERLLEATGYGGLFVWWMWYLRRQWRAVRAADALLTGPPVDLVRGRRALLEIELYNWASRPARFFELLAGPAAILGATAWWWLGNTSAWLPLACAALLGLGSAYGRLHRIPRLRREIAELEELASTLA